MTNDAKAIEGHCLCAAVSVRATPVNRKVEACHCTMCRRWAGSAFLGVECRGAVTIEGEEQVIRYRSSEWAERGACRRCGSNLFYRYLPDDHYTFAAGLFPDEALRPLAQEIFFDEKPAYYAFDAGSEKLTGAEVMEKFGFGQPDGGEANPR